MVRYSMVCLMIISSSIHAVELLQVLAMRVLVAKKRSFRHCHNHQTIRDCIARIETDQVTYAQLISTFGMKDEEDKVIQVQSQKLMSAKYTLGKVKELAHQINTICMMPRDLQTKIWEMKNKTILRVGQAE